MTKAKRQTRSDRWLEATAEAREALEALMAARDDAIDKIEELRNTFEEDLAQINEDLAAERDKIIDAFDGLRGMQEEYQEWYDNMPESLQDGATGEKLQEIINMDLEPDLDGDPLEISVEVDIELDVNSIEQMVDEAEQAELPLGFGRD